MEEFEEGDNQFDNNLRLLHELGAAASLVATDSSKGGWMPAHHAADNGYADCLRVLHELGAAASLVAVDKGGSAPAHLAAANGHVDCLHALHELGAAASLEMENSGEYTHQPPWGCLGTPAAMAAWFGHARIGPSRLAPPKQRAFPGFLSPPSCLAGSGNSFRARSLRVPAGR